MMRVLWTVGSVLCYLVAFLVFLFAVALLVFDPNNAYGVECDPTITCSTAQRTQNFGFPRMVPRMCHPEDCYNETLTILDDVLCVTTTSTSTTTTTL